MENEKRVSKLKKNIFLYFLGMSVIFIIIYLFKNLLTNVLFNNIANSRFGNEFIFEALWAELALVVLYLFKNKYVVNSEKESFNRAFIYIIPLLVISVCIMISNIVGIAKNPINFYSLFSLAALSFFVALVEEFLCRGWILNEFLDKFSNTKNGIMLSILFTSIIFALIHFFGRGLFLNFTYSIMSILNSFAFGIIMSLIFYKTKNIWPLIFIHSIWDFSINIPDSANLSNCFIKSTTENTIIIYTLVSGILLILALVMLCYWMYRRTDLYQTAIKKSNYNFIAIFAVIIYVFINVFLPKPVGYNKYYVCAKYDKTKMPAEYNYSYHMISDYFVKSDNYDFVLNSSGLTKTVELKNNNTGDKVVVSDYFEKYLLIENKSEYIIFVQKDDNNILYGKYSKEKISNDMDYLKNVKDNLIEFYLPDIDNIATFNINGDDTVYPFIVTKLNNYFYINGDNKLLMFEK